MTSRWHFPPFHLDANRRELRRDSELRSLQPQAFDLLVYLVERRDRVVPKEELLDALWRGVTVTDASLQRAVSLARQALDDADGRIIETHARRGYRFVATLHERPEEEPVATLAPTFGLPPPRYTETADGLHLAWRSFGRADGPAVVLVAGWSFPMAGWATHPVPARLLARLGEEARVVIFDRRGVGLSDRPKAAVSLDERSHDLEAVLAASGAENPVLVGFSEGAPIVVRHATRHRDVRGAVIVGGFTRMRGHPAGWTDEQIAGLRGYARAAWGKGATVLAMIPEHAGDAEVMRWAAEVERAGTSPGAALEILEANLTIDASEWLPQVEAPAIVLHHREDRVIGVENGRAVARALRNVRYVEASGTDHVFVFDDQDLLVDAIRAHLAR